LFFYFSTDEKMKVKLGFGLIIVGLILTIFASAVSSAFTPYFQLALYDACDSNTGWQAIGAQVSINTNDKYEGAGSITFTADQSNWRGFLYKYQSLDLNTNSIVTFAVKMAGDELFNYRNGFSFGFICSADGTLYTKNYAYDTNIGGWQVFTFDAQTVAAPTLQSSGLEFIWNYQGLSYLVSGTQFLLDDIELNPSSTPTPTPTSAPVPTSTPSTSNPTSTPTPTPTSAPVPTSTPSTSNPTSTPTPTPTSAPATQPIPIAFDLVSFLPWGFRIFGISFVCVGSVLVIKKGKR
jgi:hypothetical protein